MLMNTKRKLTLDAFHPNGLGKKHKRKSSRIETHSFRYKIITEEKEEVFAVAEYPSMFKLEWHDAVVTQVGIHKSPQG